MNGLKITHISSDAARLPENIREQVENAKKITVIQAENPDGDSIGSALALEEIFANMGKKVSLHCPVQVPTYLRYISGWDRIFTDFDYDADLAVIVDTSSKLLLSKTLRNPAARNFLEKTPVLVLDHHVQVTPDLPFDAEYIISDTAVSTGEMIFDLFREQSGNFTEKPINSAAAEDIYISIQADSLGLTTESTTAESFIATGELVKLGANPSKIEEKRRELMKKKPEILEYKGRLIERIEYFNSGRTALIKIPFDEIQKYSNDYNPTMLVLDEMRLVVGVDVAIGVKMYPDGKITGKLRTNIPVSHFIAKNFGGDGHAYAAGFRIYENYNDFLREFTATMEKIYAEYDTENSRTFGSEMARENYENVVKNNDENIGSFRIKK